MSIAGTLATGLALAACAPIVREHGYMPEQADLDLLLVGADTRASVADAIGTPGGQGITEDGSWFYVRNRIEARGPFEPEETERQVLVLDFDRNGILSGIARYGLEDGRVIDLNTRVTPTDKRRVSVLARLLGNVGAVALPAPQ